MTAIATVGKGVIFRCRGFVLRHLGRDARGHEVFSLYCLRHKCVWCRAVAGVAAVFGYSVLTVDVDLPSAGAAPACAQSLPPPAAGRGGIIFYYCFAGAHASVVAASLHCGLLPLDRTPKFREIVSLPYYDRTVPRYIGTPYFIGRDERGRAVYCLGLWADHAALVAALTKFLLFLGIGEDDFLFVNAFALINFSTKLGGVLSKRLGITAVGRMLSVWGIRRRYADFRRLIATVKKMP